MRAYYNEMLNRDEQLDEAITRLNSINKKMAELSLMAEALKDEIIMGFEHNHKGQKTYTHDIWKVEIRTPDIYALDKNKYKELKGELPEEFNPIKESISYIIDKKLCEYAMSKAPRKVKNKLAAMIEVKPGKSSVNIKENI